MKLYLVQFIYMLFYLNSFSNKNLPKSVVKLNKHNFKHTVRHGAFLIKAIYRLPVAKKRNEWEIMAEFVTVCHQQS